MFNWFKKNKANETKEEKKKNYKELDNGDISLCIEDYGYFMPNDKYRRYYTTSINIPKSSIISCDNNYMTFEHSETEQEYSRFDAIEEKKDYIVSTKDLLVLCSNRSMETRNLWSIVRKEVVSSKEVSRQTPLEVFTTDFKSQYKLIETEDEFNDYLASTLDCNTWCRRKLYNKMKEVGLGDGFINEFADLIGNDLDKYHAMIDLAGEVSDKDTLMYLYTYKFGKR